MKASGVRASTPADTAARLCTTTATTTDAISLINAGQGEIKTPGMPFRRQKASVLAPPVSNVHAMTTPDTVTSDNRPALTMQGAAEYLGVSPRTISRRVNDSTIPAARIGTTVRIRPRDLDALFSATPAGESD